MGRALLLLGVVLATLVLSRQAMASTAPTAPTAPFCDDRGATVLALPPILEAADIAIGRARGAATLPWQHGDDLLRATVRAARAGLSSLPGPGDSAVLSAAGLMGVFSGEALPLQTPDTHPPPGVRGRLDRPPRG